MQKFNLENDLGYLKTEFPNYGKLSGLIRAHLYNLPVPTIFWICSANDFSTNLPESKTKYLCRPDAPIGKGNNLPRGRDLYKNEIPFFFRQVSQICSEAIVLVFHHPSIFLTGSYIPRCQIEGGATVTISRKEGVTIEYVGRGFDVGDITRGRTVHTSITIPINNVFDGYHYLYRYNLRGIIGDRFDISSEHYAISRIERIKELQNDLGENLGCESDIPLIENTLIYKTFKTIFKRCVEPIVCSNDSNFHEIFGIMLNVYSGRLYIFEIWDTSRNIGK